MTLFSQCFSRQPAKDGVGRRLVTLPLLVFAVILSVDGDRLFSQESTGPQAAVVGQPDDADSNAGDSNATVTESAVIENGTSDTTPGTAVPVANPTANPTPGKAEPAPANVAAPAIQTNPGAASP